VYAVKGGIVVDMRENLEDGDESTDWGNFVVIQHDQRHYDKTSGLWGYVYSMYLHLSENSIRVSESQHVSEGDWIAQTDDTGEYSDGDHLHLQIVIHHLSGRSLEPFTLDSENNSRNPELWLKEYNSNTSRMVGKITYSDGTARPNVIICGAEKPYGGYTWSRTYSYSWANPDDYYLENFGTVDINPGIYHLYAYEYQIPDDVCGATPLIKDIGWYTFSQNMTTFVGLYPVYIPLP